MNQQIELEGKPVKTRISKKAMRLLATTMTPQYACMELYFSCLIRKRVTFQQNEPSQPHQEITPNLSVFFRPVQTRICACADVPAGQDPDLIDFPAIKRQALIPKRIVIDTRRGELTGEFFLK